ncbi:MAG: ParB/RepB/Spo0J family partition protein, partial [Proteobacteria bacterium]|nr:ParB/RepB/Spo0J family partition protein [Pseudomonadota bacterium]
MSDGALIVMSKKRLGRGLDALLSERSISAEVTPDEVESKTLNAFSEIEIASIQPSSYQPRRHFSQDALQDLANSIREQGLMQPIVVRQRPQGGYELIAGERRWRASQLAGMTAIPAMIKTVTDQEASALALIENMQREDLNAMEEAMGLARLRDEFALTQQQIADAV